MDLFPPRLGQIASAAGNVAHRVTYGGVADLRPMPRTLVAEGALRQVHYYRPLAGRPTTGDPVLLVAPLAAPATCYDLRRGCSLVEHLVQQGRPTYLVEYGEVAVHDRGLGVERWVGDVVPRAIEEVSRHAGGRPVHVAGWSLGGTFALLTAADSPGLPVASLTALASPFDLSRVPLVAPPRPLLDPPGWGPVTRVDRALGGVPTSLAGWALRRTGVDRVVTKPLAVLTHLDDADFLAQVEAVDRFRATMTAYPGRTFGQVYHRFISGSTLAEGYFDLAGHRIELSAVRPPVLVVAGNTDGIAPVAAVRAGIDRLSGAAEVRFEIVPGGHLGMLTGRAARTATWPVLDEWFDRWTAPGASPAADPAGAGPEQPAR